MIGYLKGRVVASSPERVLLDVHGVGYEIQVPVSTFYEIERGAPADGGELALYIHTHVREDTLELFGFATEREKLLFERLISVSGIGPRLARVVLSGLAPDELISAVAAGDTARLARTPGVGKKTADRLVLELQDKMRELASELPDAAASSNRDDLVEALIGLGYRRGDAERVVSEAAGEQPDGAFHELLKASLHRLSGG